MKDLIAKTFVRCTGYAYSNIGRLFLRLFVGVMFVQFGIRQLVNYHTVSQTFPAVMGLSSEASLIIMISIELICSTLIMAGFLTRLATIPPIVSMVIAECYLINTLPPNVAVYDIHYTQPGFLPIMFIGFFMFIILAGPGKISLDYFISLYIINRNGSNEEEELEEV